MRKTCCIVLLRHMLLPKRLLTGALGSNLALQVMTNDQNMLEDNGERESYPLRLSKWIVRFNSLA